MGSAQCRIYSQPYTFSIHTNPVTTAINDGPVCENSKITLTATGGTQYAWVGPDSFAGFGSPLPIGNTRLSHAGKYYVTVTNPAGCVTKDSTTIIVNPAPTATTAFANTIICTGDSIQLTAGGGLTYPWIPSTGLSDPNVYNPKASPGGTTGYNVIVSNQFSCKDTASSIVNIIQKPIADAGPDKTILAGFTVQLSGSINRQGNNFSWSPALDIDDIHSLQPIVNPPADRIYILNVISNAGCGTSSDTMFVKVYKGIFVPNAFSPNGDGVNDTWNIPALAVYPFYEVAVYSRWGQLVFYTKNFIKPWDGTFTGKPLPIGGYNYFINTGKELLKGTVLVIR